VCGCDMSPAMAILPVIPWLGFIFLSSEKCLGA
jgi:hypothetical protein